MAEYSSISSCNIKIFKYYELYFWKTKIWVGLTLAEVKYSTISILYVNNKRIIYNSTLTLIQNTYIYTPTYTHLSEFSEDKIKNK